MSLNSNALLQTIALATQDESKDVRMAYIDRSDANGTFVQFFGETEPSQKAYKQLTSVGALAKGDKVLLTKINNSYIITGRIQ